MSTDPLPTDPLHRSVDDVNPHFGLGLGLRTDFGFRGRDSLGSFDFPYPGRLSLPGDGELADPWDLAGDPDTDETGDDHGQDHDQQTDDTEQALDRRSRLPLVTGAVFCADVDELRDQIPRPHTTGTRRRLEIDGISGIAGIGHGGIIADRCATGRTQTLRRVR